MDTLSPIMAVWTHPITQATHHTLLEEDEFPNTERYMDVKNSILNALNSVPVQKEILKHYLYRDEKGVFYAEKTLNDLNEDELKRVLSFLNEGEGKIETFLKSCQANPYNVKLITKDGEEMYVYTAFVDGETLYVVLDDKSVLGIKVKTDIISITEKAILMKGNMSLLIK